MRWLSDDDTIFAVAFAVAGSSRYAYGIVKWTWGILKKNLDPDHHPHQEMVIFSQFRGPVRIRSGSHLSSSKSESGTIYTHRAHGVYETLALFKLLSVAIQVHLIMHQLMLLNVGGE
jgi:hypothetical protein